MRRDEILDLLTVHREELRREFGVESLALFGSAARDQASPASDIDILVDIPGPITLFGLAALRLRLEEILGVDRVDVVMRDAIYPPAPRRHYRRGNQHCLSGFREFALSIS